MLGTPQRRDNFAHYSLGLIGEGGRKRMEPIAARAGVSVAHVDAAHQRLQNFITDSTWGDHAVRLAAVRYALEPMTPVKADLPRGTALADEGYGGSAARARER